MALMIHFNFKPHELTLIIPSGIIMASLGNSIIKRTIYPPATKIGGLSAIELWRTKKRPDKIVGTQILFFTGALIVDRINY